MVDATTFTCPRCAQTVEERFYGPCTACRLTLQAEQAVSARDIEVDAYEPSMNVVPNQIATKE